MLNRVINDIFHLRRVHAILPDTVLGDTLKNKLLRLSLKPTLQHLRRSTPLPPPPAFPSYQPQSNALSSSSSSAASAYFIDPGALCNLLDALAYFHLGTSTVAGEAVQLVELCAPTMSVPQLCITLASCCALGTQHDITATALPLLRTALTTYTSPSSATQHDSNTRGALLPMETPLLFSSGGSLLLLMECLQKAKVREREVWHLLAEQCLRHLEAFDGRQLSSVVMVLCAEGVDDYADFYVAAERHIASQPSTYLTTEQLEQVVHCYKELHQPVVSLLALMNATPLHTEDLERAISAAATVATLSATGASHETSGGGMLGMHAGASGTAFSSASASVHHAIQIFESASRSALKSADGQGVLEVLQKCERRRVMTPAVMDAVLERLVFLYYPALVSSSGEPEKTENATSKKWSAKKGQARHVAAVAAVDGNEHAPIELQRLSQSLLTAFQFDDPALFVQQVATLGTAQTAAKLPAATVLLNALATELTRWYHPRLLELVPYVVRLLPASAQPYQFFSALLAHISGSSDLSFHEGPSHLRSLLEAMLVLRRYGGETLLVELMPAITVAVLNAPRSLQLTLTAMLAHLPAAKTELVPGIYRQWGTQKRWLRSITEEEVADALMVMSRSGLRDAKLLHAVVQFVQAHRAQMPPQHVVDYLYQLVRLGVRDLDLFTGTAEQLMKRTMESTSTTMASSGRGQDRVNVLSAGQTAVRHQQWQLINVHDLSLLLFVFTFLLRDGIRVTQQIIARLKMCAAAATPRDISLILYSFVKLRVVRSDEVTGQLCARAVATLPDFKLAELASVWSSLRCLSFPHTELRHSTLDLVVAIIEARSEGKSKSLSSVLGDADCLSLGAALLLTEATPLDTQHPLVHLRAKTEEANNDTSTTFSADEPLMPELSAAESVTVIANPLPPAFEEQFLQVCQRLLPSATGQRLYLILCSLVRCESMSELPCNVWETVLTQVTVSAASMTTGRLGETVGMAQLEVLGALRTLHERVTDQDVLAAADTVRQESEAWVTPYCPPPLWAVLRPQWRELSRSPAVQSHAVLRAVVREVRGTAAEVEALTPRRGRAATPVTRQNGRKAPSTRGRR